MATDPSFASTIGTEYVQISTANTNRDGSGTLGTVLTAGSSGTKVLEVVVEATATTTAGMVRLYISTDGGTTNRLFDEIGVTAATPSGTVACFRAQRRYENLVLPASALLRASTHNAETFNVFAFAGDF